MRGKFGWDLPPGVTHSMIEEQAGAFEEQSMERGDLLRFHYESLEYQKEEQPVITAEEKAAIAMELAKVIAVFLDQQSLVSNQEAFEVLGIATMCYHTLVYTTYRSKHKEKP